MGVLAYILTMQRARKIKCDETQPVCQQCSKSGRSCEGPRRLQYRFAEPETVVGTSSIITSTPSMPSTISPILGTDDERRAFDYFVHQVAPVLAGSLDAEFWKDLVPRWTVSDSVLWKAVVSISSMYEQIQSVSPDAFEQTRGVSVYKHGLAYYGCAINEYRQRLQEERADLPGALLSCILFAMFEFQHENIDNALRLIENGFKILSQVSSVTPGELNVREGVTHFFAQHSMLMLPEALPKLLRCEPPNEENILRMSVLSVIPAQLQLYRSQLYSLMLEAYAVVREVRIRPSAQELGEDLMTHRERLLQSLKEWLFGILDFRRSAKQEIQLWVSSLLIIYHWVAQIWLSACATKRQITFDDHLEGFRQILNHTESSLASSLSVAGNEPAFSFELGLMKPLFFTSLKCRHPILRRRAAKMLKEASGLKSIWSPHTVLIVDAIIELEETDGSRGQTWPDYDANSLAIFVPEHRRVRHLQITKFAEDDLITVDTVMVCKLFMHPCEATSGDCVREVMVRFDSGAVWNDFTVHQGGCPIAKAA